MTAQPYPILEIEADLGGDVGQQTGVFEFRKATVSERIRTGPLVESGFAQALAAIAEISGVGDFEGVTINNGGGQHIWQIQVESLGADDGQWGYTDDGSVLDAGSATGGDRTQKTQVLLRYLNKGSPDSLTPARLQYGEYAPDGFMPEDEIDVYVEDPEGAVDRDASTVFDIDMTVVETLDLNGTITGTERTG